jgi:ribosomal protein S18 acetylase RimI-like enzyme
MLRAAQESDFTFLRDFTKGPGDERLHAQIRDGRLLIIESQQVPLGFIKFYVLWEHLPFMEVILIREDYRGCGIGRSAVREWEERMADRSYKLTIVSTQADETAKHFWHRIGYQDCGSLALPGRPLELFMYRDISTAVIENRQGQS